MPAKPVITPTNGGECWPSGRSIGLAQIDVTDEWVCEMVGRPLCADWDDGLGPCVYTGGRLPSGAMISLIRHDAGGPTFDVEIDFSANVEEILAEFLRVTGLDPKLIKRRQSWPLGK